MTTKPTTPANPPPAAPVYYRDLHQTEYLCAYDLRGNDHTLVIERVEEGKYWNNGQRVPCLVLYFKGKRKGLRVNVSIHDTIAWDLKYGPDMAQWVGKAITLYPTTDPKVRKADKNVVRVRPTVPKPTATSSTAPATVTVTQTPSTAAPASKPASEAGE